MGQSPYYPCLSCLLPTVGGVAKILQGPITAAPEYENPRGNTISTYRRFVRHNDKVVDIHPCC